VPLTISVAAATFNGVRYLREQLESLARQTLLPYELVASDDASKDGTLSALHSFAASAPFPVRVLHNSHQLGFRDNFLNSARACTGDLIAFCDQDDVWLPKKLERCVEAFNDSNVVLAVHSSTIIDASGLPSGGVGHDIRYDSVRNLTGDDLWLAGACGHAMVFRRELLSAIPADPGLVEVCGGHDEWIWVAAGAFGAVAFISEPLVMFRRHGRNVTQAVELRSLRNRIRQSMRTGAPEFLASAMLHERREAATRNFIPGAPPRLGTRLHIWADGHASRARALRQRAMLCDKRFARRKRAALCINLLSAGLYRPGFAGGTGLMTALRDLLRIALD